MNPQKRKTDNARRSLERSNELKAKGLCCSCGKRSPHKEGASYCPICLRALNQSVGRLRKERVLLKKCRRCGGSQDRGNRLCSGCLEQERYQYAAREKMNLCVKCGKSRGESLTKKCVKCKQSGNSYVVRYKEKIRAEVFQRYGGDVCACCGEREHVFLTVDHIEGGGNLHRKELNRSKDKKEKQAGGGGHAFHIWLKRQGFPPGYQILCFNCNFAKWKLGKCPHQKDAGKESENDS